MNLGDFTAPTVDTISAGGGDCNINFTSADTWDDEDDAHLIIQASRGMQDTINYFKGPYRFAGKADGDAVTPPTNPHVLTLPFAVASGQVVAFRAVVVRADGRCSAEATFRGTAGV